MAIPVIDLFAGPGGLNEGFSAVSDASGRPVFSTAASFEMDRSACATLTLRGAYRRLVESNRLDEYNGIIRGEIQLPPVDVDEPTLRASLGDAFSRAWMDSAAEVHQVELGSSTDNSSALISRALKNARIPRRRGRWALIGGPPCQAYSLAGRSRRAHDELFEEDKKHFLYREYLRILAEFQPAAFVMENVKGLLSSTHSGQGMFEQILKDLSEPGIGVTYKIYSLTVATEPADLQPEDFIIRSEHYGVPQSRHRVILLGLRQPDYEIGDFPRLEVRHNASVRQVLGNMPPIRSRVSRLADDQQTWSTVRERALQLTRSAQSTVTYDPQSFDNPIPQLGRPWFSGSAGISGDRALVTWLKGNSTAGVSQHEARGHMQDDLVRYFFAAAFASIHKRSPKLEDLSEVGLLPNHASAHSEARPFTDRFRVQLWDRPSTTVVSHIAKDGHYYIHPDPMQMRSLTVREAARLQSFPDDYFFAGNKTQQYVQVGNAVPPFLANQIAEIVRQIFDMADSATR